MTHTFANQISAPVAPSIPQQLTIHQLFQRVHELRRHDVNHYRLLLRFVLFNIAAFAMFGAAFAQGWISNILQNDGTGLSAGIFLVFLLGLVLCARRVWRVSVELNQISNPAPKSGSWVAAHMAGIVGRDSSSRALLADALRIRLAGRIEVVRQVANSLVLLGLIGTVVGFIIALAGVDAGSVAEVEKVAPMVSDLIRGMSIALYTTLVGAVLSLWLTVNYHILAGGAVKLVTSLVQLGEANAGAWSA